MKRLIPLFLILLSVQFCSCSGFAYTFGEEQHKENVWNGHDYVDRWSEPEMPESPMLAFMESIFSLINTLSIGDVYRCNTLLLLTGVFWVLAITSMGLFILGWFDDVEGEKRYSVIIDNKRHNVVDYSDAYTVAGSGSVERGYSWASKLICLMICAFICYLASSYLFSLFGDINMLIKVLIVGTIIYLLYLVWNKLLPLASKVRFVAWAYCALDFVSGIIITLINN